MLFLKEAVYVVAPFPSHIAGFVISPTASAVSVSICLELLAQMRVAISLLLSDNQP